MRECHGHPIQITFVKKISSGLGVLRLIRDSISLETAFTLYNALVLQYFDYCDVVWDNMSKTSAVRLQKLQNLAARIITKSNYDIRSRDILHSLGWDNLHDRRTKHKALMMFKSLNGLAPQGLKELFNYHKTNYNLRNGERCISLPKHRTEYLKRAFSYDGAKLWNSLSKIND